ncbi:sulfurtransferase complex subunit TusB [Magnetospirillum fulvum]|uniref:tRNA 2-thiouridine synthesizing protein B n=1 Tax=Magnetospirillum fulvum TaxID=1082 RepID=A0A1H6HWN0_MAGFU|nr:sulfurtransferase complex subunit TusB [Magnetospirillum fulvum]SEH40571.1 tRNA 2-thiouridine synthesizing protein B [Magnetospirillum fulvum]
MLHTVNKSPFERNTLEACLKRALPGSAILLIEDSVYAAQAGTVLADAMSQTARAFDVFVLGPDLAARGIDPDRLVEGVWVVDYGGFVDLAIERGPVQSWL